MIELLPADADDALLGEVVALWERCGLTRPWNDAFADLRFALASPHAAILLVRNGARIVGTAMVGHDGHRGAVYYLSVDPDAQRNGIGSALLGAAAARLAAAGVPRLNIQVRAENAALDAFYLANGFERLDRIVFARAL